MRLANGWLIDEGWMMLLKIKQTIKSKLFPESTFQKICKDIDWRLPKERLEVFFDVGANTGQTIESIRSRFPRSSIYSFEPNPTTFEALQRRSAEASTFNIGLSSKAGEIRFDVSGRPDMHRIAEDQNDTSNPLVEVKTLDIVSAELGIISIDYLKIDTEGHDLEVLKGGAALLENNRVNIIEVECGVSRDNTHHIPFVKIQEFLENFGYRLFGIYEQVTEWPKSQPHLRRINAAFISPQVIARNPYKPW